MVGTALSNLDSFGICRFVCASVLEELDLAGRQWLSIFHDHLLRQIFG